jgi:hypothetical protein
MPSGILFFYETACTVKRSDICVFSGEKDEYVFLKNACL